MIMRSSTPPAAAYDAPEAQPGQGMDLRAGCAALVLLSVALGLVGGLADTLRDAGQMLHPLIFLAHSLIVGTAWWVARRGFHRRRARQRGMPVPPWRAAVLLLIGIPCFLILSYAGIQQDRIRAAAAMPKEWPTLVRGGVPMSLVTRLRGDSLSYRLTLHCAPAQACPPDGVPAMLLTLYGPEGMEQNLYLDEPERRRNGAAVTSGDTRIAVGSASEYLAATCWTVEMSAGPQPQDRSPGCAHPQP